MSTSDVPSPLRLVWERAGSCCEYCLVPESMTWAGHTIDHVVAEKHGGTTSDDHLALACTLCNSRKGSDLASIVQESMPDAASRRHRHRRQLTQSQSGGRQRGR